MTRKSEHGADPLLSSGQAGGILGVTAVTVRRYGKVGKLTAVRRTVGGHFRWREAEVRTLAASLLVEAEPQVAA